MAQKRSRGDSRLFTLIGKKDSEGLAGVLENGANPNATQPGGYFNGATALMHAAGCQFPTGVKLLLNAGADPNLRTSQGEGSGPGWTALHEAITGYDSCPNDPEKRSQAEDRLAIVRMLLEAGANPSVVYNGELTPIGAAARAGEIEIVRLLLKSGGNTCESPDAGAPALVQAAGAGHLDIVRLLLEHGSSVNCQRQDGVTPLISAAYRGAKDVVLFLIANGAALNHQAQDGRTALIAAAQFDRSASTSRQHDSGLQIAEALLQGGARTDLVDRRGKTALDHAANSPNPRIASLLTKANER